MILKRVVRLAVCGLFAVWCVSSASAAEDIELEETVITSDRFEMQSGDTETEFVFSGNIHVKGEDLVASCNDMRVMSDKAESESAGVGDVGKISSIVMMGDVVIEQGGRRATSNRAEIFPNEGKVVLTESPKVVDADGTMTGHRMTLFNGEHRILVEREPGGERPKLILPDLPQLGLDEMRSPPKEDVAEPEADLQDATEPEVSSGDAVEPEASLGEKPGLKK